MNLKDNPYYIEMLHKDRLIPFFKGDRLVCFITFYICNEGEEKRFLRDDMWSVEEDNPQGNLAWIDQVWSDKKAHKYSFEIWGRLKSFIRECYPSVKNITWRRWKNKKVNIYREKL